ncbi:hypothetical protein [Moorena producens]|nr:hypothetical protein [Moorena producens]
MGRWGDGENCNRSNGQDACSTKMAILEKYYYQTRSWQLLEIAAYRNSGQQLRGTLSENYFGASVYYLLLPIPNFKFPILIGYWWALPI